MRAGELDRRVQFRRLSRSSGDFGQTETWADHGKPIWASKNDISDSEKWRAATVEAVVTSRFKVRWSAFTSDIQVTDRLICEGLEYNIIGLKEIGRHEGIEITAAAQR